MRTTADTTTASSNAIQPLTVLITRINTEHCRTRDELDQRAVEEYCARLDSLDAIDIFDDGTTKYLACGAHRIAAHQMAGKTLILARTHHGTALDAIKYGIEDNRRHIGVRITQADRRQQVRALLKADPEMADRTAADFCGVSPTTVGKVRRELSKMDSSINPPKRTGKDGKKRAATKTAVKKVIPKPRTHINGATIAGANAPVAAAHMGASNGSDDLDAGARTPPCAAPFNEVEAAKRLRDLLNAELDRWPANMRHKAAQCIREVLETIPGT